MILSRLAKIHEKPSKIIKNHRNIIENHQKSSKIIEKSWKNHPKSSKIIDKSLKIIILMILLMIFDDFLMIFDEFRWFSMISHDFSWFWPIYSRSWLVKIIVIFLFEFKEDQGRFWRGIKGRLGELAIQRNVEDGWESNEVAQKRLQ